MDNIDIDNDFKVWILKSKANDYNQPDEAFEKLYFFKPTKEELGNYLGVMVEFMEGLSNGEIYDDGGMEYWVDEYSKINYLKSKL